MNLARAGHIVATSLETLQLLLQGTILVLLAGTALVLTFSRPATVEKRLLALVLGILAATQVSAFMGRLGGPGAATSSDHFWVHTHQIHTLAIVAFCWFFPTRPPLRSWQGGLLSITLALAGFRLIASLAWPRLLYLDLDATYQGQANDTTLMLVLDAVVTVLWVTAVLLSIRRASSLPTAARAPAFIILVSLIAGVASRPGSVLVWTGERMSNGENPAVAFFHTFFPGGFDWAIAPDRSLYVVLGGVMVWMAYAHGSYLAIALTAYGALRTSLLVFAGSELNLFSLYYAFPAICCLHAINRFGALGTAPLTSWKRAAMAGLSLVMGFLAAITTALASFGESALVLASTIFVGLVVGVATVIGADPRLLPAGARSLLPPERLAPYRAALAAEIATGAQPDETSRKLRGLRHELGITDPEHALMDYTMRTSGTVAGGLVLAPGQLFAGRYRVERGLGREGGGPAYLCRDELAARPVVVKLLPANAGDGLGAVLREARALAAVRHPNVATLYDVVTVGDSAFLVMEHAEGGSLSAHLGGAGMGLTAWRSLARDLLDGLVAVHAAGVVHRDVKPSNVLVTKEGRFQLADFGVATVPGLDVTRGGLQRTEDAVGTVPYMSPEVARGRPASVGSDLYGAGATLFEALAGEPYFRPKSGESALELQMRVARAGAFRREVRPRKLRAFLARALDPDPARRFATAREMRDALDRALGEERQPTRRRART